MVAVHVVPDEESHCCTGERIRCGVSSATDPRNAHRRRQSICQNCINFSFGEFASSDPSKRPRLDRVAGRKCITALKEGNGLAFDFKSWPLRHEFEDLDGNLGVGQGLDSDSACVSRTWVVASLTDEVEGRPHWVDGIRGAQP